MMMTNRATVPTKAQVRPTRRATSERSKRVAPRLAFPYTWVGYASDQDIRDEIISGHAATVDRRISNPDPSFNSEEREKYVIKLGVERLSNGRYLPGTNAWYTSDPAEPITTRIFNAFGYETMTVARPVAALIASEPSQFIKNGRILSVTIQHIDEAGVIVDEEVLALSGEAVAV